MLTVLYVHLSKAGRFFVVRAYENINNLIFHGQCRCADFAFVSVAGELWVEGIALEAHCLAFIYGEQPSLDPDLQNAGTIRRNRVNLSVEVSSFPVCSLKHANWGNFCLFDFSMVLKLIQNKKNESFV